MAKLGPPSRRAGLIRQDPAPMRRPRFRLTRLAVRVKRLADDGDRLVRGETLDVNAKRLDHCVELGGFPRTVDKDGHAERAVDDEGCVARMEA
ncbi:MAG: hypothetical protein DMF89_02280 [Acidobacteria bacterium]|nr:MAG: hypothetical protein DMF89_02280 [Acidobacteriota bacterium]